MIENKNAMKKLIQIPEGIELVYELQRLRQIELEKLLNSIGITFNGDLSVDVQLLALGIQLKQIASTAEVDPYHVGSIAIYKDNQLVYIVGIVSESNKEG